MKYTEKEIPISEIEQLLKDGKLVTVKTLNGEYAPITQYIKKGNLKTYAVETCNGFSIKVSAEHKFLTNAGWIMTQDLILSKHLLSTELGYSKIKSIEYIGFGEIVDVTVDHPEHCYYGNGIMNHNSGKSLLAAHALKNTQKLGGVAVYIDTESAVSEEYLNAIGVDVSQLIYMPMDALENIFQAVETIISKVRESNKDRLVTIVVDSIMGASTLLELESTYEKDGYATSKAIILSKAMRKLPLLLARQNILLILTNQLRVNMGVSFGEKYTTSGGKAVGFASSLRLRLSPLSKIKVKDSNGIEAIVGVKTNAKVTKNRMGPPLRDVNYDIYFDSGVDNYGSWLETLKEHKIVTSGTLWSLPLFGQLAVLELVNPDGGEVKAFPDNVWRFKSKDFKSWLMANPKLKEALYDIICEKLIMKYKLNEDFGVDDISYDSDVDHD